MTDVAAPPDLDRLERARSRIASALFEPLTLTELSAAAGLSTYHFVRQFSARFGASPIAYLRAQRLAAAADRLAAPAAPPLVELAFDCGFSSQDSFTRAFKRAFGVPPGRYRQAGRRPSPEETLLMTETAIARARLTQAPAPVRKPGLRIAGLSALFDETNKAGIPALWDGLVPRLPLPGQAGAGTFGVCAAAPEAEPGGMRYMAGVAIAADAPAPAGLEVIDLAPQAYLVFRQDLDAGDLHPQMQAAAREIWGERLPASAYKLAQSPDLEVYPADFEPGRAGAVIEWWIPVEA